MNKGKRAEREECTPPAPLPEIAPGKKYHSNVTRQMLVNQSLIANFLTVVRVECNVHTTV